MLSLHAVNDLPGALLQLRRLLKPDGLFIAALFGGETLKELRAAFATAEDETLGGASPRVAPFADVRDLGGLLQRAGFTLPVADVERTVVRYRDLSRLFGDLRALGETNVLASRRTQGLSARLSPPSPASTSRASAIPKDACPQHSRSSFSPAGRRTKASRSRCHPAARRHAFPTLLARSNTARAKPLGPTDRKRSVAGDGEDVSLC